MANLIEDVLVFIAQSTRFDYDFELLRAVDSINNDQIERFINKIRQALGAEEGIRTNLEGFSIAILGLAFKPNTDDMRDAPSVKIINGLIDLKAKITAYDPQAMANARKILPNIEYAPDIPKAIKGKDALVIITEWPQFSQLDLKDIKDLLKKPIIVDGRNIYDPKKVKEIGIKYVGIGQ